MPKSLNILCRTAAFLLAAYPVLCQQPKVVSRNIAAGVAYVGSEVCGRCHADILRSYRRTGMGRSMSVTNSALLKTAREQRRITNEKGHRTFEAFVKDGDLYQSESGTEGGSVIFQTAYRLDYAIGSGDHGFSFIARRGRYLFQAPLSLYARTGTWDLSPGYEHADYGFNRPIPAACVACHSGRPQFVADRNGLYGDPPFAELAIGCENCHGPGELHVKERTKGVARTPDTSIVNPSRLDPRLAENICMNCHQTGDARVLQPGKTYADFRPGTWLGNTLAIFKVRSADRDADLLEHHNAMQQSRCFIGSAGKLSCLTCHDPHVKVEPADAPAYFRARCLTCHNDRSCKLPAPARAPLNDCAGCHMPKRDTAVISHTALTNHRIIARVRESLPATTRESAAAGPALDYVDEAPASRNAIPPLSLLKAYGEVMVQHPEFRSRYIALLDELSRSMPDNAFVEGSLGRKLLYSAGDDAAVLQALQHLENAVKLGANSATVHQDLAEALARLKRLDESVAQLKIALELEPYDPVLHKTLALRLIALKDYPQALQAIERYVALFPEDDFMRELLAKARSAR